MVCHTDFHSSHNSSVFKNARTIKHGITRYIRLENSEKKRITFWRDPSYENGADIAKAVFENLAIKYPNILFTFMVRPYFDEIDLTSEHANVEVFKFPYVDNVSIEQVLGETIACLFPFRELSTNPQLSILETLKIGIPCICSRVESASEYGIDERLLINNPTVANYEEAIEMVIRNPKNFKPGCLSLTGFIWDNYVSEHRKIYEKNIDLDL